MIRIRNHSIARILAIAMGVVFLNMSFFLTEVRMLDLDESPLIENIAKLLSTIGCEEEKDGFGESKKDSPSQSVDFSVNSNLNGSDHTFLIADNIHKSHQFNLLSSISGEIPTPPPWIG